MSYFVLVIYLMILSILDVRRREFPGKVIWTGLGVALIYSIWKGEMGVSLMGALPGVLLVLMSFLTQERVGYGDGVLVIIMGLVLGWPGGFIAYVLAQFGVLFYAVILLVRRRGCRDTKIPFAPFLTVGVFMYGIGGAAL